MIRRALLVAALTCGLAAGAYAQTFSSTLAAPVSPSDVAAAQAAAQSYADAKLSLYTSTATQQSDASTTFYGQRMLALGLVQPPGSYAKVSDLSAAIAPLATQTSLQAVQALIPSTVGFDTTTARQADTAATRALIPSVAGFVSTINGIAPTAGAVNLSIGSVGNVSGVAYFHRYSNVSLTVPAIGVGAIGTGTASVPGTAAGDQCFVAPTAGVTTLGYVLGAGWVTTAGTVKVTLAAGSLIAITAGTLSVNMLCAQ